MGEHGGQQYDPVGALRTAFGDVRKLLSGNLATSLAQYDAEMVPHNAELIARFLGILPVQLELPSSEVSDSDVRFSYEKLATSFIFTKPDDIRMTSLLGLFLYVRLYDELSTRRGLCHRLVHRGGLYKVAGADQTGALSNACRLERRSSCFQCSCAEPRLEHPCRWRYKPPDHALHY